MNFGTGLALNTFLLNPFSVNYFDELAHVVIPVFLDLLVNASDLLLRDEKRLELVFRPLYFGECISQTLRSTTTSNRLKFVERCQA